MNKLSYKTFTSSLGDDWQQRLDFVLDMVRQISRQTDPQTMVATYMQRMRQIMPSDGSLSLSRRGLNYPYYRITRSSRWKDSPDPWNSPNELPLFKGGLLADLIYREQPTVMDEIEFDDDDSAAEYFAGHRSLAAIPLFDGGKALNMVVVFRNKRAAYDPDLLPEHVWLGNLFGRATHNLVLSDQLRKAYDTVDRELKVVADIQRSLLPVELPEIPTLDLAVYYQTSRRAGGDYYDFFKLPDDRWGFLIADVSGHGTPAAVIMAVTHSIAHTLHEAPTPPSKLLNFINRHLTDRYTGGKGTFVTAFYGIYDPKARTMTYSSAGHNPPRHKRAGQIVVGSMEGHQRNFPLGIDPEENYMDSVQHFEPGDSVVFYTDGITEARHPQGEMFGVERLDQLLLDHNDASATELLDRILSAVEEMTGGALPNDDRTLLTAKIV